MVFITVSSGIGGGIVTGGRLLEGARGLAGHVGQIQGAAGGERLEDEASGFAMARAAEALGRPADTRALFQAASEGDAAASRIIDDAAAKVARSLIDLQRLVDPELVVLGGGIGLLPAFKSAVASVIAGAPATLRPRLASAELGSEAGIVGIADLVLSVQR